MRLPRDVAAWSLVALALTAGTLLRFGNLGARSLWLDEIMAAIASGLGAATSLDYARGDVTPPLHYLLMVPFARSAWPEFWLRVPAALSGVVGIVALYAWQARRGRPRAGAWAAFCFALSPFALFHAQDARMYSHMMLFSMLAMMFLDEMLDGAAGEAQHPSIRPAAYSGPGAAQLRRGLLLTLALTLGLYNSYFAAFLWTSLALYLAWRVGTERESSGRGRALPAILAMLVPVALLLPWLVGLPENGKLGFHFSGLQVRHAGEVAWSLAREFGGGEMGVVFWPLVGYGLGRAERRARMLGAMLFIVPAAFLLVYDPRGHFFAARYLAYLFPFAVVAAGWALAELEARLVARAGWRPAAATAALAAALALSAAPALWRYERGEKENWRQAAAILAQRMKPGDVLLTGVHDARIAIDYYLARGGASPLTEPILRLAQAQPPEVFPLRGGVGLNRQIVLNPNLRETWQLEELEALAAASRKPGDVWWVSAHPEAYARDFHVHLARRWERVAVLPALERWGEIRVYRMKREPRASID